MPGHCEGELEALEPTDLCAVRAVRFHPMLRDAMRGANPVAAPFAAWR
jgi:hypothetical protein